MKKVNVNTSALAPVFERIEKFTKIQRIIIYSITMILVLAVATWFFFLPKFDEIKKLEKNLAKVKSELTTAKKNASELNDWRNKMKEREAKYLTVMRALPEKEEIPSLLSGISQAGKDAGLEILLFTPKNDVEKDFYAEIPVDITVSGNYHNVAVFFDKVANLPRIVNIRNIKMTPQGESGLLTTQCQAVTYKFIEEKNTTSKTRPKNKRKR